MKARRRVGANGGGGPPTDLLVCFPTRAHLTLMPKPISSPSRTADHSKCNQHHHRQYIPMFRTNRAQKKEDITSEPTSPKVTCAGQIKIRPKNRAAARPESKNWLESVGLKKDVMNFMGALRGLRFNMQCFGMFHAPVVSSSDEEEEEEPVGGSQCKTVLSKWFMMLEENQGKGDSHFDREFSKEEEEEEEVEEDEEEEEEEEEKVELPPKNALLLMRCRSAPSRRGEEEEKADEDRLMIMSYAPDYFKLSTDIAKETWIVGSADQILARSRSWRR